LKIGKGSRLIDIIKVDGRYIEKKNKYNMKLPFPKSKFHIKYTIL
jgi:hypothetical protein